MAGAVLTGGASRRMGRDKALIEIGGIAMARRIADALTDAGCAQVMAVGGDEAQLSSLGLVFVPDRWPGDGPLGGILTALAFAGTATCVVACDLPSVSASTLTRLVIAAASVVDVDVVAAWTGRLEPLCAVWLPTARRPLEDAFFGGERAVQRAMEGLRVATITINGAALRNVNTPADLRDAAGT